MAVAVAVVVFVMVRNARSAEYFYSSNNGCDILVVLITLALVSRQSAIFSPPATSEAPLSSRYIGRRPPQQGMRCTWFTLRRRHDKEL